MRGSLVLAISLWAIVPAVSAQNARPDDPGANNSPAPQIGRVNQNPKPTPSDDPPPAVATPAPEPKKSGPIRGVNLTDNDTKIQATKYQGDPPSGNDIHRPSDIGGSSNSSNNQNNSGSSGASLGVPRSGGIGQSSDDDNPEEKYNWGAPGSNNGSPKSSPSRQSNGDNPKSSTPGKLTKQEKGYDDFDKLPSENRGVGPPPVGGSGPSSNNDWQFGDNMKGCYNYVRKNVFQSDHDFDDFMSITSNPLYGEDPRTLTELRPIFMYQTIPGSNFFYRGGNIETLVLQGRLAFGDRFSVVVNQVGWTFLNPSSNSPLHSETGFMEMHFGAKYTWLRDRDSNWISAVGMNVELPTGPGNVYQNTGTLGLQPYLSFAHKFGKTSYGTWGLADTFGVDFSVDKDRTEFFYNTIHLDYDIANMKRFYPFIELNWFNYFQKGAANPFLNFQGGDIANTGASYGGTNYMDLAFGSRFRITEAWEAGLGLQFPISSTKDLNNFRMTVDVIWRY